MSCCPPSHPDRLAAANERRVALGKQLTQVRTDIDREAGAGAGSKSGTF